MTPTDIGEGTFIRSRPPLPIGLDPRDLDDAMLVRHGLPVRPVSPELLAIWNEAFSRPMRWVDAQLQSVGAGRSDAGPATDGSWAGAQVFALNEQPIKLILGRWNVPYIDVPGKAVEGMLYDCCTWVGIDDSDVCQGGVQSKVSLEGRAIKRSIHPFFQWFGNSPMQTVRGIPVTFGDEFSCMICIDVDSATSAAVLFNNITQGVATSIQVVAAKSEGSKGNQAEWIVERTDAANGSRPLARFDTVHFTNAVVATAELATVVNVGDGQLIDMKENGSIVAKGEPISSTSIDVNYTGLA